MAIISLILGIIGLLTAGSFEVWALLIEITALVLGAVSRKKSRPKIATAGFVMGIIGCAICVTGMFLTPLGVAFIESTR